MVGAYVLVDLHLISEEPTRIPDPIIPTFKLSGITDEDGLVTIGNITFDTGISSLYYTKPLLIYSYVDDLSNQNLSIALQNVVDMILEPSYRYTFDLSHYDSFSDGLMSLYDVGLIDFIYYDFMSFQLVSQVGSLKLLNETQTPSIKYQLNTEYTFSIKVFSLNNNAVLANSAINLDFNLIHFPSYLISDYVSKNTSDFKTSLITFTQINSKTDANGVLSVKYNFIILKITFYFYFLLEF